MSGTSAADAFSWRPPGQNNIGLERANFDKTRSSAVKMFNLAAGLAAAGQEESSAEVLRSIPAVPDSNMDRQIRILLMLDERSLFHYRSALNVIAPLLKNDSDQDLQNKARLLNALIDVQPETVESATRAQLWKFRFTAAVGREKLSSFIDTGASFSALSRSAAMRAGLRIRPANYAIQTAFGKTTHADIAVGDIRFSNVRISNAVFLVLSDRAFGNGFPSMVIGIPVLRQLALTIGERRETSLTTAVPMRFHDGSPVVETLIQGVRQECELDTGADRSSIAAARLPVRAFDVTSRAEKEVSAMSATGKARLLRGFELPIRIALGNRTTVVPRVFAIASKRSSGSRCSLGRDALQRVEPLTLDFRSMRLILR